MAASKTKATKTRAKARNLPPNLGSRREGRRKKAICTRCEAKTRTVFRIEKGEDAKGETTRTKVKASYAKTLAGKSILCANCAEKRLVELERYDAKKSSAPKVATKKATKATAKRATAKAKTPKRTSAKVRTKATARKRAAK